MKTQTPVSVQSIHHGAVPTANVARAMGFYGPILGAQLQRIVNGTVSALQHGYPQVVQLELAGCDAFGLALQYDSVPAPRALGDGATWGLVTSAETIERLKGDIT